MILCNNRIGQVVYHMLEIKSLLEKSAKCTVCTASLPEDVLLTIVRFLNEFDKKELPIYSPDFTEYKNDRDKPW